MSSTFVEAEHPRSTTGRFAAKSHAEADLSLDGGTVGDSDGPDGLVRPGRTPPQVHSHSSLSDFSFCATRWALERIDGAAVPDDADDSMRQAGIVAHEAAELAATGAGHDEAIDTAMGSHRGAGWYRQFRDGGGTIDQLLDKDARPADAPDDVVAAVAAATSFDDWELTDPNRDTLVATEVTIDAEIDGVALTGVIDAVEQDPDGAVVVTDYKTGKPPSQARLDGDDDLARFDSDTAPMYPAKTTRQLVLYAEMAEATGRHVDRVRLLYPASRKYVEVDLDGPYGDHLRTEARQFVVTETDRLIEAHETGVFPASPSPRKCASCSQAENCPAAA